MLPVIVIPGYQIDGAVFVINDEWRHIISPFAQSISTMLNFKLPGQRRGQASPVQDCLL